MEKIFLPTWKPVSHIREGWDILTSDERKEVDARVENLFKGNFIKMKTNPVFYLHVFSFLAQVEVLAIQIPLKFMTKFDEKVNLQLRRQLIDEIVHGLIFTKMAFYLALPLSQPVPIIEAAEKMCDDIRSIEDEKLALISLNLIAEGWIEEVFKCVKEWGFADDIFINILSDEERHVSDAELYSKTGIETLEKSKVVECIRCMENNLIEALSSSTVTRSFIEVGDLNKYNHMKDCLLTKHKIQLDEIGIKPSKKWLMYEKTSPDVIFNLKERNKFTTEIPGNLNQKYFCKVWESPKNPIIDCEFDLVLPEQINKRNVTIAYIYFVAKIMETNDYKKNIILSNNHKILKINNVNLSVRVLVQTKAGYEIGTVNLFDVQNKSIGEIRSDLNIGIEELKFWKNERIAFSLDNDEREGQSKTKEDFKHSIFSLPTICSPCPHAITNIGSLGYDRGRTAMTSLNSSESCLGLIKTVPIWNESKKIFEPTKILPVSLMVDHRILNPHDFNIFEAKKMFTVLPWNDLLKDDTVEKNEYIKKISLRMSELMSKKVFFENTMSAKNRRKMLETLSMSTF